MAELTDRQYEVVRAAINLARDEKIASVKKLTIRLKEFGYGDEDIQAGLSFWASQVKNPTPTYCH